MAQKTVYIIFKTHLDIGFTDYAKNVIEKFIKSYIPNAIKVGNELKDTDTPFIWTVGSWLIEKALKSDESGVINKAIQDGILNWHGLPFTTHTEAMNPTLFKYGLNISKKLDKRFGRKTISAKMTDVPGHTIGMVPYMCQFGIKFLHIGVNPATPLPPIPPLFRWKCGDDSLVVMYQGDYGDVAEFDDFVVYFAHTHDNCAPQNKEQIIEIYSNLRKRYPGYELKAATLNDIAERICSTDNLPIVDKEIGDTWIHGIGTDPEKISRYRNILRKIENIDLNDIDISDNLLLVPEHTWGMDIKTFFNDKSHWSHLEMEQVKDERSAVEKSWQEQRNYVLDAEHVLNIKSEYPIIKPNLDEYDIYDDFYDVGFEISWQLFSNEDYRIYKEEYLRLTESNRYWALWDNTKVGLPEYDGKILTAHIKKTYKKGQQKLYKMEFEDSDAAKFGLPYFYVAVNDGSICIKWFNKKASRLPQAFWFKLKGFKENWEINKLGQWIAADNIIGSPFISGVDKGVRNEDYIITPLDSALVAPFGRRLLRYNEKNITHDMYFNLYNNIWNTNFPMWYSGDSMFRFEIKKRV